MNLWCMKKMATTFFGMAMLVNVHSQFHAQLKKIDSLLQETYSATLPGASIAIVKNKQVFFEKSYGLSNLANKEKLTPTANFNIASLTKQFTAIAILQLQAKHQLLVTDAISKFFPGMNRLVAGVVTIQDLLTHSSGIIDHYSYANTKGLKHAHDIDVYNAIKNIDSMYFKPGAHFRYSNTAYCLLALVIEKVSGKPYNIYMKENIFTPAGMMHTNVWNEKTVIPNMVTGYEYDSASNSFKVSGPVEHIFFTTEGDGGIYTSVADYAKWFAALQNGTLLSKNEVTKARRMEFTIDANKKLGYGYGWFIDESDVIKKVYHSGSNSGFRSFSFTIPGSDYLVIIFSNRDDIDLEMLVQKIVQIQWPSLLPFTRIEVLTS